MKTVLSEETWKGGLTQFYYNCVDFWSISHNLGEDDSIKMATQDCLKITAWPFSPKEIRMPEDIKAWYHEWLKREDFYLKPLSRAGVNKMLEKYPTNGFWHTYKAYDDPFTVNDVQVGMKFRYEQFCSDMDFEIIEVHPDHFVAKHLHKSLLANSESPYKISRVDFERDLKPVSSYHLIPYNGNSRY